MQYISLIVGCSGGRKKNRLSLLHSVELHFHHALNHSHPSTLLSQFSLSMFCVPRILPILTYLFHSTPYRFLFNLTCTYFTLSHILIRSQSRSLFPIPPLYPAKLCSSVWSPDSALRIATRLRMKDPGF